MIDDEANEVARVAQGDRAAYARLVSQHLRPIEAYAMRIAGNAATAQDVVQEVMLRLWLRAGEFQPERARLTTWLHQMAHHLCIDKLRRAGRLTRLEDDDVSPLADHVDDSADDVQRALAQLPERQRQALVLTYYQGLTNAEVAEVMGLGVRAVESLLVRARASLKQLLEQADDY